MSDRTPSPERRPNMTRRAALALIAAGLVEGADQLFNGGRITDAILHFGQTPAAQPPIVVLPTSAALTPTPRSGAEMAQFLIDNKCQVKLVSPARSGFATQTKTAVMQTKGGVDTYNPEDLEELASLPTDLGGAPESGYWRLQRKVAFIRGVWVPDLNTANTQEKLVGLTTGIVTAEQVIFSGLVRKPAIQDGLSSYARANYFFVTAVGSSVCEGISAEEMHSYTTNPGLADALAGQAYQETIKQSPLH